MVRQTWNKEFQRNLVYVCVFIYSSFSAKKEKDFSKQLSVCVSFTYPSFSAK